MKNQNRVVRWGGRLVGAAIGLVVTGCVEGPTGLQIEQNQIPTVEMNSCVIPAERTTKRSGSGVLDVGLDRPYGYEMYPLLANVMPSLAMGGFEPNRIEVTAFEVELQAPPTLEVPWTPACPNKFDTPHQATLMPGQDAGSVAQVIRPCHAELFRELFKTGRLSSKVQDEVIFRAVIRARGSHGSSSIRSANFTFPIRVCYGCLQSGYTIPQLAEYAFPRVPPCAKLPQHPYMGNPCNPAQDAPILCCSRDDQGTMLECPGQPRVMGPPSL